MSKLLQEIINFLMKALTPLSSLPDLKERLREIEKKLDKQGESLARISQQLDEQSTLLREIAAEVVPPPPGPVTSQTIIFAVPK
jgi:predicted DNA-binding ArsR family transcriptional regulator